VNLYLDLLKKAITGELYLEDDRQLALAAEGRVLDDRLENLGLCHTMIGRKRLDNIESCLDEIVRADVPGDLIECGVWRGGGTVFMRGYLAAHGIEGRTVWVADSFAGLPPPSLPGEEDLSPSRLPVLAVPLESVRGIFARYGLLDAQVRFLPGWFRETLDAAPIGALALLRIDADLYTSTRDALRALYRKLSPGGFVIIDDYHCIPHCRLAVDEFREAACISEPIERIDWTGIFWRKASAH